MLHDWEGSELNYNFLLSIFLFMCGNNNNFNVDLKIDFSFFHLHVNRHQHQHRNFHTNLVEFSLYCDKLCEKHAVMTIKMYLCVKFSFFLHTENYAKV